MELKRLITHFTYRIEPKPEGGFIAHPVDPAVPPLEAPTRAELQQKIQANIAAALAAEFSGLKLPLNSGESKFAFHVELKPGGGFAIQSADPDAKPIEGRTHEEIESHFAGKLLGFVGKHFVPELSQLTAQGGSADVKVSVNATQRSFIVTAGSKEFSFGNQRELTSAGPVQPNAAMMGDLKAEQLKTSNSTFNSTGDGLADSPIMPEANSSWRTFLLLLGLMLVAGLVYFILRR